MQILINLLLIQFIIVNLIDISGFISELEAHLSKWLKIRAKIPKPFSCAYCSTWWTGLIYLIVTGNFTLYYIAALLFICSLTTVTSGLIYLIKDFLLKIITSINKKVL